MTIDQAIERASAQIDALLQQRLDDIALRMIADGADPNTPPAPDPDASWQQESFDEVLQRQRAINAEWKLGALAQIRKWLEAGARRDGALTS